MLCCKWRLGHEHSWRALHHHADYLQIIAAKAGTRRTGFCYSLDVKGYKSVHALSKKQNPIKKRGRLRVPFFGAERCRLLPRKDRLIDRHVVLDRVDRHDHLLRSVDL